MSKKGIPRAIDGSVQLMIVVWLSIGLTVGLVSTDEELMAGWGKLYLVLLLAAGWLVFVLVRRWHARRSPNNEH